MAIKGSNIGKLLFPANSTQCNPHFPTISSLLLLPRTFSPFKPNKEMMANSLLNETACNTDTITLQRAV